MRRLAIICAPLVLLGAVLWLHHPTPRTPTRSPHPATTPISTAPPPTAPSPTDPTPPSDPTPPTLASPSTPAFTPTTAPDTTWTRAAAQFTQAYARPTPAARQHWATGVQRWLSPSAQLAFTSTNPLEVPFTRVTGPATLHDAGVPVDVLALAQVPTDHGSWWVAMVRRHGVIQVVWYGSDPSEMPQ